LAAWIEAEAKAIREAGEGRSAQGDARAA
jgi:hypothetical protein